MKKMLFVVFAVVLVAAMFLPVVRAGPVAASEEPLLASAVPSANFFVAEKVGIVAQLPVGFGLSAYIHRDFEAVLGYQSKEWVRNRSERVRITKWPMAIIASTLGSFDKPAGTFSLGNTVYGIVRV